MEGKKEKKLLSRLDLSTMVIPLIVIIALSESSTLINTILICISCFLSFILLCPFVTTFKNKLKSNGQRISETYYSFFFFFLAILILIISVFDVSWLNSGVIQ